MNINTKINLIKKRVINLTSHFPYTKEEINYLTIAYLAFIMLDESISDLIDEVLTKVFCLFTSLSIEEAYELYISSGANGSRFKDSDAVYEGYYCDNEGEISYIPYLIISTKTCDNISDLFDFLLHELKHALNEVINKGDKEGFYSGLSYVDSKMFMANENLDEAFNSFLTSIYLENISYLSSQNIEDEGIREIIAKFHLPEKYSYSYSYLVYPSLPLFQNRKIFWGLYNASLYKNMFELNDILMETLHISLDEFSYYFDYNRHKLKKMGNVLSSQNLEKAEFPKR